MGCGESKHVVSTANTILQRKKSTADTKRIKDEPVVIENGNKNENNALGHEEGQKKDVGLVVEDNVADTKEIKENMKSDQEGGDKRLEEANKEVDTVVGGKEEEKLVSQDSPKHSFSSKEGIDGVVSEGLSGKSEYYSPLHVANKDDQDLLSENSKDDHQDNTMNEEDLVVEGITKEEKENDEVASVKEESLEKEAKPGSDI